MWTRLARRVVPLAFLAAVGAGVAVAATGSHTGTVNSTNNAKYGALVVNAGGRTLYHMTSEKNGHIVCTGACAKFWPPLTIAKGAKPTAGAGIKQSKLGTVKRPDGTTQVTYYGYALYRYGDDKKRGDVKGEGEEHIWFVVNPSGKLVKSAGSGEHTTSTSSTSTNDTTTTGYGYGGGGG